MTGPAPAELADPLVRAVLALARERAPDDAPVVVGIDGRSGSGTSSIAAVAATILRRELAVDVLVVEGDDFYAGGSATTWDGRSTAEKVERVIDWRAERMLLDEVDLHAAPPI